MFACCRMQNTVGESYLHYLMQKLRLHSMVRTSHSVQHHSCRLVQFIHQQRIISLFCDAQSAKRQVPQHIAKTCTRQDRYIEPS